MRVAIVGAGALGWVIGARLARLADCAVVLVARVAAPPRPVRLERVDSSDRIEWTSAVEASAPAADIVLSSVRYENLDAMADGVASLSAPVVVLTPMMPGDGARLTQRLGARWVAAMPSVVAYWSEPSVIRYWIPRSATMLVEAGGPNAKAVAELAERLERAGIATKVEPNVLARNAATTVSFLPWMIALDIAKGIDPLLADRALLRLAFDAAEEGRALARVLGPLASWATFAMPFVRPLTLKMGIGIARSRAPEVMRYVNEHFGRKLHAQNVAMGASMVSLARERGCAHAALEKLVARLET